MDSADAIGGTKLVGLSLIVGRNEAVTRRQRRSRFGCSTRRALLGSAGIGLLGPMGGLAGLRSTRAASPSDLHIGQLKTGGTWDPRPTALRRLLWEIGQRTSIEVSLEPAALEPESPQIFRHPFLYWAGSGSEPEWSEAALRNVRRHLSFGGVLLVDDADAVAGGAFDRSVRRTLRALLPREELAPIPVDHVLFKTFYLVPGQTGRVLSVPHLWGSQLEGRYAVIYSNNDLGGAWARDAFGRWEHEVLPGGDDQREMAFRLGVNIAMYALCLDYKDDLVHTPFILRRRR